MIQSVTWSGRRAIFALTMLLLVGSAACATEGTVDPDPDLVDRNTFVLVYTDLRVAALSNPRRDITEQDRDAVLQQHGVTSDDLLAFAEYYGPDIAFMRDVWNDIETRLDSIRQASTGPSPGDPNASLGSPSPDSDTGTQVPANTVVPDSTQS